MVPLLICSRNSWGYLMRVSGLCQAWAAHPNGFQPQETCHIAPHHHAL